MIIELSNYNPSLPIILKWYSLGMGGLEIEVPYRIDGTELTINNNDIISAGIPAGYELKLLVIQNEDTIYYERHIT